MENDLIIFVLIIAMFVAAWIYGHKGVWGKVASRYSDNSAMGKSALSNKGFDIGFIKHGKWEGGFYSHLLYSDKGIFFKSPIIIRLFLPNIYIPWGEIEDITNNEKRLLGQQCSEIKIKNFDIGILVPSNIAELVAKESNILSRSISLPS